MRLNKILYNKRSILRGIPLLALVEYYIREKKNSI
jgi:hypothetical protein